MNVNLLVDCLLIDDYFHNLKSEYKLTRREGEILQKLSLTGLSNEELGAELKLSEDTIRNYLSNIMKKMGVKSFRQVQAIVLQKTLPPIFLTAINPRTNTRIKSENRKTVHI